jgi:hypothetical protein
MVMRGRTLEDYVYVDSPALDARAVRAWVRLALPHVLSLPPKSRRRRASPGARRPKTAALRGKRKQP